MCWHDILTLLHNEGIDVTEAQLRWLIKSRRVSRPQLDGSLRFDFRPENVAEIRRCLSGAGRRRSRPQDVKAAADPTRSSLNASATREPVSSTNPTVPTARSLKEV